MKRTPNLQRPNVVGVVHGVKSLEAAKRLAPSAVDILELRLDAFARRPQQLFSALPSLQFPLLITARHPLEGGPASLAAGRRRELLEMFLPSAALLDIELRSIVKFAALAAEARVLGIKLVLSYHNFKSTPSNLRLRELARQAKQAQGDILKIATHAASPSDLATVLHFMAEQKRLPISAMGMGPFGKVSRLLFAQAGSILNYGYLDRAVVPGQWPAAVLKKRIAEILSH